MDFRQQASFVPGETSSESHVAGTPRAPVVSIHVPDLESACAACHLREMCLPMGLTRKEVALLNRLVYSRRKLKRGESLYRAGDPFNAVYAIRTGFFKCSVIMEDGRDQVTGFRMPGEIIGMDGIGSERHSSGAIALEDSEVCTIPFFRVEEISNEVRGFQRQFHRIMSREILRDQGVMMLLGRMHAEERLAAFLLDLSQRFMARGYSPSEFHLRMTREEIGSFLGLKLETVSRIFSRFQEEKLISVCLKRICILDMDGLQRAFGRNAGCRAPSTPARRCATNAFGDV